MQRFTRHASILALGFLTAGAYAVTAQNQGRATAVLQRQAARFAAQEDYLVARALCLNDTSVIQDDCRQEAQDELEDERELIDEQFEARIDLLDLIGTGPYDPDLDPQDFSANVTNNFFPLVPGRTLVYEAVTPEGIEHVEVTTTNVTRTIEGIPVREVRDTAYFNGEVVEDTVDWFAQEDNGDVWYMGEFTLEFEDGFVDSDEGSWRFGKDGAKPGIQMRGQPALGETYREEYLLGEAEDVGRVLAFDQSVTVPAGVFHHCIAIEEWSPLSPGPQGLERKYFAPGVGLVLALHVVSGEREELVAIMN